MRNLFENTFKFIRSTAIFLIGYKKLWSEILTTIDLITFSFGNYNCFDAFLVMKSVSKFYCKYMHKIGSDYNMY